MSKTGAAVIYTVSTGVAMGVNVVSLAGAAWLVGYTTVWGAILDPGSVKARVRRQKGFGIVFRHRQYRQGMAGNRAI